MKRSAQRILARRSRDAAQLSLLVDPREHREDSPDHDVWRHRPGNICGFCMPIRRNTRLEDAMRTILWGNYVVDTRALAEQFLGEHMMLRELERQGAIERVR